MGKVCEFLDRKIHFIVIFCFLAISFVFVLTIAAINRESLNEIEADDENDSEENVYNDEINDGLIGGFTAPDLFKQIIGTNSIPLTPTQPMDAGTDGKMSEGSQTEIESKQPDYVPQVVCYQLWLTVISIVGVIMLAFILVSMALDCITIGHEVKPGTINCDSLHHRTSLAQILRNKNKAQLMSDFPIAHHI